MLQLVAVGVVSCALGCQPSDPAETLQSAPRRKEQVEDPAPAMRQRLAAALLSARQAMADHRYAFSLRDQFVVGESPTMGMRLRIQGGLVEVASGTGAFNMELASLGRGELPPPAPRASAVEYAQNRAVMRRGPGIDEWYLLGPLGVEQGWTLRERPPGSESLTLVVTFAGVGSVAAEHDALLTDESGSIVARYSDLFVQDADGEALPSSMEVGDRTIRLHVNDAHARYPIEVDPLVWVEQAKLLANDGAADDLFGKAVSASGDDALVGTPWDDDNGGNSGSAYVFVRSGSGWSQQQKLLPTAGAADDSFGWSVSLSGNTAVVGAYADDDNGLDSGSATVFFRSGSTWTPQQTLIANDGAAGDNFGYDVSLSGDTALVGAPLEDENGFGAGAAYVFLRSGSTWSPQQKLLATDGAAGDVFAVSVSVHGDTALAGAPKDGDNGPDSGSAYVFFRSGSTWGQQQKLLATDGAADDDFGRSVSVSGDTALVGAPENDDSGADSGSAYVFVRSGSTWAQQQKLLASDAAPGDVFGAAVSVLGDTAIVGAPGDDDNGSFSGSAYIFVRSGNIWIQQEKLVPAGGAVEDFFGDSVSAASGIALAGARGDDDNGSLAGSAYVFGFGNSLGESCATSVECASGHCADGVCCDTECGGGISDDCIACNLVTSLGTCSNLVAGAACGNDLEGECDHADTCDGAGYCQPNLEPNGAPCGDPASEACDGADTCDGVGFCQSNVVPSGAACGDQGIACRFDDSCNGAGSCLDNGVLAAGTPCGEQGVACHVDDTCDASGNCVDNVLMPAGSPCGDATDNVCTAPDSCDASGQCAANHAPPGTPCGPEGCLKEIVCNENGMCVGSCPSDTYCEGLECLSKKPNGEGCGGDEECASAACSDGICCNIPCARGGCGRCDTPGSVGVCVLSPAGEVCRAAIDASCDADEKCDGVNSVCPHDVTASDGTSCAEGSCKSGFCLEESTSDDAGCGCALPGRRNEPWWAALMMLAPLINRRSQRRK